MYTHPIYYRGKNCTLLSRKDQCHTSAHSDGHYHLPKSWGSNLISCPVASSFSILSVGLREWFCKNIWDWNNAGRCWHSNINYRHFGKQRSAFTRCCDVGVDVIKPFAACVGIWDLQEVVERFDQY